MTTVPGIENDGLNLAHVRDSVRPQERLNGFGYVSPRHQRFSILFNHRKAQPTSSAIDDGFPAAADKFQRAICCLCLYFRPGRDDLCGQFVKLGNIVHAQIIVAIYFDYLPLGSSNGTAIATFVTNNTPFSFENYSGATLTNPANNAVLSVQLQMRRNSAVAGVGDSYQVRSRITRRNIL